MDSKTAESVKFIVDKGKLAARKEPRMIARYFVIIHAFLTALMIDGLIVLNIFINVPNPLVVCVELLLINLALAVWYALTISEPEDKDANPAKK